MLPYAATTFLSAFLLFLIQPLIAKQILPWFGGSAAVWTTCMLFFQMLLLAGYAYADGVVRWLKPRTQVTVHVVLLLCSLALLPIVADASWKPAGNEDPIVRILLLLLVAIGLPYLMLSATTPLLQAWYWRRFRSAVPYRLFALSNAASLLALVGYPLLVEPWFGGLEAARAWSVVYVMFMLICGFAGLASLRGRTPQAAAAGSGADTVVDMVEHTVEHTSAAAPARAIPLTSIALWLVLPALGSALLLAITNHITQNIASVPFLWVLPLALYLLTFIICFDHPRWYQRPVFVPLLWVAVPFMAWMADSLLFREATATFAAGLFLCCMFCHGELSRRRPDPDHLTLYYVLMSLGGALGALIVAIGAPLALSGYYEMQIGLVTVAAFALALLWRTPPPARHWMRLPGAVVLVLVCWLSWENVQAYRDGVRMMERDFYGVVRTKDRTDVFAMRVMLHGPINHGGQLLEPKFSMSPSTYFGPTSGYGRVFRSLPQQPRNVGVIGLGAGALAAYARAGDQWVFYEISPAVVKVAHEEFTFLKQSPAKTEIVLGDGRLALEREAPRSYDVLAIDAFSGDSIPMHLLTREAMALYIKHLKPDGVIVFQATNRFVDILPVIRRLADDAGFTTAHVSDTPSDTEGPEYWLSSTDQVIVSRNRKLLQAPLIAEVANAAQERKDLPPFTDDYYNLIRILK